LTRKKNSAASNFDFERKKTAYFTRGGVSPFALTTQVLQYSEWTPKAIDDRQKELLERLEQHWRLTDRKNPLGDIVAGILAGNDGTWRDDVREGLRRIGERGYA
jgi:hypothetical protein